MLDNDLLNATPVNPAEVSIVPVSSGPLTVNADGTVTVAPSTPAGTYLVTYEVCEIADPSNCDTAEVSVTVDPLAIDAVDDPVAVSGFSGGTIPTVLGNDIWVARPSCLRHHLGPGCGTVTGCRFHRHEPGWHDHCRAGHHGRRLFYPYTICEVLNPANCDTATATITVDAPAIVATDDAAPVSGLTGGTAATVLANDTLNGAPFAPSAVNLTPGAAPSPAAGSLSMNPDGTITVAPGTTAGVYTYPYTICEVLNPANCDTADAVITVTSGNLVANADTGAVANGIAGGPVPA